MPPVDSGGPPHGCPADSGWHTSHFVCRWWTTDGLSVANPTLWLPPDCHWWSSSGVFVAHSHWWTTGVILSGKRQKATGGPLRLPHQRHTGGNQRVCICHWCTTDDTLLSNNVASGPPTTCWTSMWWATSGKQWRAPGDLNLYVAVWDGGGWYGHHWQRWLQSVGHQWSIDQRWAVLTDRWLCYIWL